MCGLIIRATKISIHALREEGDYDVRNPLKLRQISIHALREEGDELARPIISEAMEISIHALREEGDLLRQRFDGITLDFYPRPPRGGRLQRDILHVSVHKFLSTPSARRATRRKRWERPHSWISIHALREEGDLLRQRFDGITLDFYPRPPRGGRLQRDILHVSVHKFLSTPSARRATRRKRWERPHSWISIHALREEGDKPRKRAWPPSTNFYPRPPRGGRPWRLNPKTAGERFLSTPSARRATPSRAIRPTRTSNFYPRPPRGGRPAGGLCRAGKSADFYPRPPRGGRQFFGVGCGLFRNFYPRPPRGGRPVLGLVLAVVHAFLSTPSARRATSLPKAVVKDREISIHALREEGDDGKTLTAFEGDKFLSTPSARRATLSRRQAGSAPAYFYPRPPRGGRPLLRPR